MSIEKFPTAPSSGLSTKPMTAGEELAREFGNTIMAIVDPFDTFHELFGKGGHLTRKQ